MRPEELITLNEEIAGMAGAGCTRLPKRWRGIYARGARCRKRWLVRKTRSPAFMPAWCRPAPGPGA
jgi:hypothetical protein